MTPPARESSGIWATVGALVLGAGGGAALVGWHRAVLAFLGSTPEGLLLPLALAAAGVAFGLNHRSDRAATSRDAGRALLVLGGLTVLVGALAEVGGSAVAWVGASLEATAVLAWIARALVAAALVVPPAYFAGTALQGLAGSVAPGGGAMGFGLLGLTLGAALAQWSSSADDGPGGARIATGVGAAVALGTGIVLFRSRAGRNRPEPTPTQLNGAVSAFAGFAVAFAAASWAFLGQRVLVWAFGNTLPAVPVGLTVFLLAAAAGALLGVVLGSRLAPVRRTAGLLLAITLGGVAVILGLGRYDELPARFAETVTNTSSMNELLRAAFGLAVRWVAPAGVATGLAGGLLAAGAPSRGTRPWLARVALGVAFGVVLGSGIARLALPAWGIGDVLILTSLLAVAPAAVAVARTSMPGVRRLVLVLVCPGVVATAAVHAPPVDRDRLLLDRGLVSNTAAILAVQRNWKTMDRDGAALSAAVMRRGHERRLLVNGRFELAPETAEKSQGLLAHLPLAMHPDPRRVVVIGTGTGWAIASALAHPVERIDVLESSPVLKDATREFGTFARAALDNERVHLHLGDPAELLSRAGPADIILSQVSREWTTRSSAVSTREFLAEAKSKLGESGFLAQWVPVESLTREGFLILLATFADMFPRVEIWAGQDGDVVLLASSGTAPHDFRHLLEVYGRPDFLSAATESWLGAPEVLLSQFLLDDAGVRELAAGHAPHTRNHPRLRREEAARRLEEPTVNPVPGLRALGGDVLRTLTNTPDTGFRAAMENVRRSRELELTALDLESQYREFDAVAVYREALELNPRDGALRRAFATLRTRMGIRHANLQKFTAAHTYLREAVEIDPTYAQGFANLGNLLIQSEDYDYAISSLGQATLLEPENDLFFTQLGRAWQIRGYHDKALPYFGKAIELNPRNVDAHLRYIDAHLTMQGQNADLREGLAYLEDVRSWAADNPDVIDRINRLRDRLSELEVADRDRTGTPPDEPGG
jgi:spermidine synthase